MRRRGFSLVELTVTIVVLAIVLTIALPLWRQMYMAGNEARVIETMRSIQRAVDSYRMQGLGSSVPPSIGALTGADPPYLPAGKVGGPGVRLTFTQDGYNWTYAPGPVVNQQVGAVIYQIRQTYTLVAMPQNRGVTGQRAFFTSQEGAIHYDTTSFPGPNDPTLEGQSG